MLLVEPSGNSFKPISTHAGGLAWYGDKLYVADTKGLLVFDTRYFLDATKSPEAIDQGYRWVLPQVGEYAQNGARKVRISSVRPTAAGRRSSPAPTARRSRPARRALGPARRRPDRRQRLEDATSNVQGVLQHNNVLVASSSYDLDAGTGIGELLTGAPKALAGRINWPDGAEDVHYAGTSGRIYSLTEKDNDRIVFAIDGSAASEFRAGGPVEAFRCPPAAHPRRSTPRQAHRPSSNSPSSRLRRGPARV